MPTDEAATKPSSWRHTELRRAYENEKRRFAVRDWPLRNGFAETGWFVMGRQHHNMFDAGRQERQVGALCIVLEIMTHRIFHGRRGNVSTQPLCDA